MMDYIKKFKGILILFVVIVGGFYVYASFFNGDVVAQPPSGSEAIKFEQELLSELLSIQRIQLSEKIFSDPAFEVLYDFSQPIPPLPKGRENPFAPFVRQPERGEVFTRSSTQSVTETEIAGRETF